MILPLEDIKILDLTRYLPGPFCTMILADMGADIVKIEEVQPRWIVSNAFSSKTSHLDENEREEILTAYQFVNRNKRSICLNLKTREAQKIFHKLAEDSDVVVEEFRPGVTKRLSIDYETLRNINPRIIYCAISGYGQNGPYRDIPGHDPCYIGIAGVLGITGTPDGHHVLPGVPIGDLGGGMQGVIGILCAIIAREKTGHGQFVDIAMTDSVVSWLVARHGQLYFSTGSQPELGERPSHVYETKDGKYICVSQPNRTFGRGFAER